MKRRVTTTEYYGFGQASQRSRVDRVLDYLLGDSATPDEFYPPEQKRRYYDDTQVLLSLAFNNGILYGGCCFSGCPRKCVPFSEFCPRDAKGAEEFECLSQTYSAALSAKDKDVAAETRGLLEKQRNSFCSLCPRPEASSHPQSTEQQEGSHS